MRNGVEAQWRRNLEAARLAAAADVLHTISRTVCVVRRRSSMRRGPIISFLSIIHEWIFGKSILFGLPPKKGRRPRRPRHSLYPLSTLSVIARGRRRIDSLFGKKSTSGQEEKKTFAPNSKRTYNIICYVYKTIVALLLPPDDAIQLFFKQTLLSPISTMTCLQIDDNTTQQYIFHDKVFHLFSYLFCFNTILCYSVANIPPD